jgi:NhaP-type Na+/H+ or K+/H+ antiporter
MEGTWRQIDALATALLAYTLAADLGGFMAAFAAGIVVIRLAEQRPRAPVRCQRNR